MYDSSLKAQWDYDNSIAYAKEKGIEKGRRDNALNIAREMKQENIPLTQIVKFTRLEAAEIEAL